MPAIFLLWGEELAAPSSGPDSCPTLVKSGASSPRVGRGLCWDTEC